MYSPMTWLTISEQLPNFESCDPESVVVQSPTRTVSYSALLLDAGKLRVKDCSMMDPSRVMRTISMLPL